MLVTGLSVALLIAVLIAVLLALNGVDWKQFAESESALATYNNKRAMDAEKENSSLRWKAQSAERRANRAELQVNNAVTRLNRSERRYHELDAKFQRMTKRKQGAKGRFVAADYPDDKIGSGP